MGMGKFNPFDQSDDNGMVLSGGGMDVMGSLRKTSDLEVGSQMKQNGGMGGGGGGMLGSIFDTSLNGLGTFGSNFGDG